MLGRWGEAEEVLELMRGKASAACSYDSIQLALLAVRRGDLGAAMTELEQREAPSIQSSSQREMLAAEVALERGRPEEALHALDRAQTLLAGSDYGIEILRVDSLPACGPWRTRPHCRPGRAGGRRLT